MLQLVDACMHDCYIYMHSISSKLVLWMPYMYMCMITSSSNNAVPEAVVFSTWDHPWRVANVRPRHLQEQSVREHAAQRQGLRLDLHRRAWDPAPRVHPAQQEQLLNFGQPIRRPSVVLVARTRRSAGNYAYGVEEWRPSEHAGRWILPWITRTTIHKTMLPYEDKMHANDQPPIATSPHGFS